MSTDSGLTHAAPRSLPPGVLTTAVGLAGTISISALITMHPAALRPAFAACALAALLALAGRWPRAAIITTLTALPFMALARRVLIDPAGWSSYDPLLLVAPVLALALLSSALVHRHGVVFGDRLSKLIGALLVLAVLEALNPTSGSPAQGVAGLLFIAAPLLWFFLGRAFLDRRAVALLVGGTIVVGLAIALYGMYQTQVGLPPWDAAWVRVNGFAALNVGGVTRAFGTLSNASEYGLLLGGASVFAVATARPGRRWPLAVVPILMGALLLASLRSVLVLTVLACLILLALKVGRPGRMAAILIVGLAVAIGALQVAAPALESGTRGSTNALVSHQVGGLTNPLDPRHSTLLLHLQLATGGIGTALAHPLGLGTAATNIASAKGDGEAGPIAATEVDLSNAFVGLGLLGGALFAVVVCTTLVITARRYRRERDPLVLAIFGLLVVALGQWLNGGNYALSALIWTLAGWGTRLPDDPS